VIERRRREQVGDGERVAVSPLRSNARVRFLAVTSLIPLPVLTETAGGFPRLRRLTYSAVAHLMNLWAWSTPALTLPALEVLEVRGHKFAVDDKASPDGGVEGWAAALVRAQPRLARLTLSLKDDASFACNARSSPFGRACRHGEGCPRRARVAAAVLQGVAAAARNVGRSVAFARDDWQQPEWVASDRYVAGLAYDHADWYGGLNPRVEPYD